VFFREEHTPGTSLLVLKMHHCISDGYGVVSFLNAISDKPQDLFAQFSKPPIINRLISTAITPYYLLKILL